MYQDLRTVRLPAPAKINLFLDVTSKRDDGYHAVTTVMHSVSLADTVEVTLTPGQADRRCLCSDPTLPTDRSNLALRAADRYFEAHPEIASEAGCIIRIEKRIPVAAGLAGGSTDAAAVLRALSLLCGTGHAELPALAKPLGADVPFCLSGGCAIGTGIGAELTPLPALSPLPLLICKPGEGISTKEAYAAIDTYYQIPEKPGPHADADAFLAALRDSGGRHAIRLLYNCFEAPVIRERPDVASLLARFLREGALNARLSGSGPSVFGVFTSEPSRDQAQEAMCRDGIDTRAAHLTPAYAPV